MIKYFNDYYRGKRVLVTGHTGFKGGWLSLWLKQLGATVFGLSNGVPDEPNFFNNCELMSDTAEGFCDVRNFAALNGFLEYWKPEVVFHLAARAIVNESYEEPRAFVETNVMGTANLLEAVRALKNGCKVIVVTSDKCYASTPEYLKSEPLNEQTPMGGRDVYSASKGAQELITAAFKHSFFCKDDKLGAVVTVRAGNVIGGGDYSRFRLMPDCVRALAAGVAIKIHNPGSVRPWQHVLDCLSGYLWLGAVLKKHSPNDTSFNFGPEAAATVDSVVKKILAEWNGKAKLATPDQRECQGLYLSIAKARDLLGWQPTWDLDQAIKNTIHWYRARHLLDGTMTNMSLAQIGFFQEDAHRKKAAWAA